MLLIYDFMKHLNPFHALIKASRAPRTAFVCTTMISMENAFQWKTNRFPIKKTAFKKDIRWYDYYLFVWSGIVSLLTSNKTVPKKNYQRNFGTSHTMETNSNIISHC